MDLYRCPHPHQAKQAVDAHTVAQTTQKQHNQAKITTKNVTCRRLGPNRSMAQRQQDVRSNRRKELSGRVGLHQPLSTGCRSQDSVPLFDGEEEVRLVIS